MSLRKIFALAALGAGFFVASCGGDTEGGRAVGLNGGGTMAGGSSASEAPASTVTPTGRVIEVKMVTDGEGNYFEPADFEVHRGDLIRFVLVSGVHNVSFPAAENRGKKGLPAPSDYLQLPGQTFDLLVTMEPGRYFYQCDPHAALGMVGHIEVEDD
jgi:plastocyanin